MKYLIIKDVIDYWHEFTSVISLRKCFSFWPSKYFFLFIWTLNFIKTVSEYMDTIQCSFLALEIYCLFFKVAAIILLLCEPLFLCNKMNVSKRKRVWTTLESGNLQTCKKVPPSSAVIPTLPTMAPLIPEQ